jgi:hypothetical protein
MKRGRRGERLKGMRAIRLTLVSALIAFVGALGRAEDAKTVPALRYRVMIYEGVLDMTHGAGQWIEELYFPSRGVVCNVVERNEAPTLNAFFGSIRNRFHTQIMGPEVETPTEAVEVPRETAEAIFALAELTKRQREEGARLASRALAETFLHTRVEPPPERLIGLEPRLGIVPLEPPKLEIPSPTSQPK